jgi:hypothetical protein
METAGRAQQQVRRQPLTVFSIREVKNGAGGSIWVRAGRAFVNADGSLNVLLDVLPLDGRLHVRATESGESTAGGAETAQ